MPPARVLIVDGDAAFAEQLRAEFARLNEPADMALSGEEGVNVASALRPDAVVVSSILNDFSGFKFPSILASDRRIRRLAVVLLSTLNEQAMRLVANGASGVALALSKDIGCAAIAEETVRFLAQRDEEATQVAIEVAAVAERHSHQDGDFTTFLAYGAMDYPYARNVYRALSFMGHRAAMDERTFVPAANWRETARAQISRSKTFTLFASRDSRASVQVAEEIKIAREFAKPIMPVHIDTIGQDAFGEDIAAVHWLTMRRWVRG